jgi:hypothetical protein
LDLVHAFSLREVLVGGPGIEHKTCGRVGDYMQCEQVDGLAEGIGG